MFLHVCVWRYHLLQADCSVIFSTYSDCFAALLLWCLTLLFTLPVYFRQKVTLYCSAPTLLLLGDPAGTNPPFTPQISSHRDERRCVNTPLCPCPLFLYFLFLSAKSFSFFLFLLFTHLLFISSWQCFLFLSLLLFLFFLCPFLLYFFNTSYFFISHTHLSILSISPFPPPFLPSSLLTVVISTSFSFLPSSHLLFSSFSAHPVLFFLYSSIMSSSSFTFSFFFLLITSLRVKSVWVCVGVQWSFIDIYRQTKAFKDCWKS